MADTFGALEIPVDPTTSPVGDPTLGKIGRYIQAVLNVNALAAWTALRPRDGNEALPIKRVFFHNPEEMDLNPKDLPALFLYRKSNPYVHAAGELRGATRQQRGSQGPHEEVPTEYAVRASHRQRSPVLGPHRRLDGLR